MPQRRLIRVLVVDDDLLLCEMFRVALELEGIEVAEAHHVIEAERALVDHVVGLGHLDSLQLERDPEHLAQEQIVIDDQDTNQTTVRHSVRSFMSCLSTGRRGALPWFLDRHATGLEWSGVQLSAPKWALRSPILTSPAGVRSLGRGSGAGISRDL